jgi:hypothetical protein
MIVKIDDDLAAKYAAAAEESKQPLDLFIGRQLARFLDYPPTVRVIPVAKDVLQQIEKTLGGGQITTAAILLARIQSYAQVRLGDIVLDLSPVQKQEVAHRAEKRGIPPEAVVKELVDLLLDQMFDAVTPYR